MGPVQEEALVPGMQFETLIYKKVRQKKPPQVAVHKKKQVIIHLALILRQRPFCTWQVMGRNVIRRSGTNYRL